MNIVIPYITPYIIPSQHFFGLKRAQNGSPGPKKAHHGAHVKLSRLTGFHFISVQNDQLEPCNIFGAQKGSNGLTIAHGAHYRSQGSPSLTEIPGVHLLAGLTEVQ